MNSKTARAHFYGNLKIIGERSTNPEKYNLYFGLGKLAEAVSDLERQVQLLKKEMASLQARLP
jgi:hypothetical protein